ncbi:TetR/AcrR family transcriptional regulator [Sphingobium tyrosinilyticum]|uniref:TetR/AcrR family transcriptional regulator n=1 Tax=Sphingobium tyrosinilyticum TaxID=2715436 RepID=A0ABV9F1G9_9SPHN
MIRKQITRKRNKSGQVLGRKGSGTRDRVLEALGRLLADMRGVAPTAAAVAREAGMSAPAFYLYFSDVGEAVLALLEQREHNQQDLLDLLAQPWPKSDLFASAGNFVTSYLNYWSLNAPLLRARNRLADQGDERFIKLRVMSAEELTNALAGKIGNPPFKDGLPCSPTAMATVLVTALERLATVSALNLYPDHGADKDEVIASLANMIAATMQERA